MVWNDRKPWNRKNRPWYRRSRKAGTIPASRIPRSIARVRSEWVTMYNAPGGCTSVYAPWTGADPCNPLRMAFTVIDPDQLTFDYGDDVKVAAMVGSFAFRPIYERPSKCSQAQLDVWRTGVRDSVVYMRGGLYKQATTEDSPTGLNPKLDEDTDWSDVRLIKRYVKKWFPAPYRVGMVKYPENSFLGVQSGTNRAQYTVPATSSGSQPLYNVPAITSSCSECFASSEDCYDGFIQEFSQDHPWKVQSVNMRKIVRLRENDMLQCIFSFMHVKMPDPGCSITPGFQPCGVIVIPEVKVKIQYG